MEKISDYIDTVLEPWQIAQKAESVMQALALIEEKFNVVFKEVDFEVLENEGYGDPLDNETPTETSEDEEE
jgi:hypothetical protein